MSASTFCCSVPPLKRNWEVPAETLTEHFDSWWLNDSPFCLYHTESILAPCPIARLESWAKSMVNTKPSIASNWLIFALCWTANTLKSLSRPPTPWPQDQEQPRQLTQSIMQLKETWTCFWRGIPPSKRVHQKSKCTRVCGCVCCFFKKARWKLHKSYLHQKSKCFVLAETPSCIDLDQQTKNSFRADAGFALIEYAIFQKIWWHFL